MRSLTLMDRIIAELDAGLRTVFAVSHADRAMPATTVDSGAEPCLDTEPLAGDALANSIRLMRVNHAGEVCADSMRREHLA